MNHATAYASEQRQNQEEILTEHLPLVKRIALHLMARIPAGVELDDLLQAGMMGLLAAIRNFSPDHGASFTTYAGIRIRGAIFDELRRLNWAPRSIQQKVRKLAIATREVEARTGTHATSRVLADEMGLSIDEYHELVRETASSRLFGLEDEGEEYGLKSESDPLELVHKEGFREALAETINQLPERESLVMALYYQEELNLREIGEVLEVSESRVCQIHGQALNRVRVKMSNWT